MGFSYYQPPASGGGGGDDPTALKIANDLSDLNSDALARANLGLTDLATTWRASLREVTSAAGADDGDVLTADGVGAYTWEAAAPPVLSAVRASYTGVGDATDTQVGAGSTEALIFETVAHDVGGDYDETTGVWTAPNDGIALCSVQINHSGNTTLRPELQHEPAIGGGFTAIGQGADAGTQPDENSAGLYAAVYVSAGDKLRPAAYNKGGAAARIRGIAFNTDDLTHMSITLLAV